MLRCMLSRPITIRRSLNLDQLLDGAVICRLCLFIDLDIQHFRAPAVKTRRRARVCQCTFAARKHCRLVGSIRYFRESRSLTTGFFLLKRGQVRVAKVLGSDLCPVLRGLHFDERALHRDVHRFQTSAFPREQAPGAARDLVGKIERFGIQISAVGSICHPKYKFVEIGSHSRPWEQP
jgi:hypothetical protein